MKHFMVDLETMGTGSDAAIVAIGAVAFEPDSDQLGFEFYRTVSLDSAMAEGGIVDAGTVMWWLDKSDEARNAIRQNGASINFALNEFALWLRTQATEDETCIWGNSAAFDNVILANAYRRSKMPVPWHHWNDRCYRTMKSLNKSITIERTGTHHNALDDAVSQARHLVKIFDWLRAGAAQEA